MVGIIQMLWTKLSDTLLIRTPNLNWPIICKRDAALKMNEGSIHGCGKNKLLFEYKTCTVNVHRNAQTHMHAHCSKTHIMCWKSKQRMNYRIQCTHNEQVAIQINRRARERERQNIFHLINIKAFALSFAIAHDGSFPAQWWTKQK